MARIMIVGLIQLSQARRDITRKIVTCISNYCHGASTFPQSTRSIATTTKNLLPPRLPRTKALNSHNRRLGADTRPRTPALTSNILLQPRPLRLLSTRPLPLPSQRPLFIVIIVVFEETYQLFTALHDQSGVEWLNRLAHRALGPGRVHAVAVVAFVVGYQG